MDIRKQFAKNLTQLMKDSGKRQQDLREELGYSSSTLSQWCNGKFIPRPSRVEKLAKYFGVSVDALYVGEDTVAIRELEDKALNLASRLAEVTAERDVLKRELQKEQRYLKEEPVGTVENLVKSGLVKEVTVIKF